MRRNKVAPVNSPNNMQENVTVCMAIFEMLRACQVNYIRYVGKKAAAKDPTRGARAILEPFLVRMSANNETFDKVLCQMFRVDPYQPTVRTLDLSLRFFKGSSKQQHPEKKSGNTSNLVLRPDISQNLEYFD
jgi:hypothetical protein